MARRTSGEQKEASNNEPRVSVAKVGKTVSSRRATQRELFSVGPASGRVETQVKGRTISISRSRNWPMFCMNEVGSRMGTTWSIGWRPNGKLKAYVTGPHNPSPHSCLSSQPIRLVNEPLSD